MTEKHGTENLKKVLGALENMVSLVEAAKKDDGEFTWTDLFNRDVLEHGLSAGETLVELVSSYEELKEEVKDLSTEEAFELVQASLDVAKEAFDVKK